MPNGYSDGFSIKRTECEQLLRQCDSETPVGKIMRETIGKILKKPEITPGTASDLWQVLDQWKGDDVGVEEQDHTWYIVYFPDRVNVTPDGVNVTSVIVTQDSPLFEGLRRHHAELVKEREKSERGKSIRGRVSRLWARIIRN